MAEGQSIGYRRPAAGPGTWTARLYRGNRQYDWQVLGSADDVSNSDGQTVLSWKEALSAAHDWWQRQRSREDAPEVVRAYFVADACRDYLEWFRAHRQSIARTEYVIVKSILPELGRYQLAGPPTDQPMLNRRAVREWHVTIANRPARLRSKPGKPAKARMLETDEERRRRKATANRELAILKAALNFAVKEGEVSKAMVGTWDVEDFEKVDRPVVRFLTVEELNSLLDAIEDADFRNLVEAAGAHTGCDYGELARMDVCDFFPDTAAVRVRGTKNEHRDRIVFLSEEGARFFGRLVRGHGPSAPLFPKGKRRWRRAEQTRRIREACERAKIHPPIRFKDLRHTYASLYLMAGGELPALSKQLGHADTRMTQRTYAHLALGWRSEDARRFAPRLGRDQEDASS